MTITNNPTVLRRLLAVGAALGLLVAAGCGGDDDDASTDAGADGGTQTTAAPDDPAYDGGDTGDTGGDTGGDAGGAAVPYTVDALQYSDVAVPAGGTLEIENTSGAPHTFTADEGEFDVEYGPDQAATVDVPAEAGDYAFHCNIHPSMAATLTVE
jgi:plastocyanin